MPQPGKYRVLLDSDDSSFDGEGRVGHDTDHFSSPETASGTKKLLDQSGCRRIECYHFVNRASFSKIDAMENRQHCLVVMSTGMDCCRFSSTVQLSTAVQICTGCTDRLPKCYQGESVGCEHGITHKE